MDSFSKDKILNDEKLIHGSQAGDEWFMLMGAGWEYAVIYWTTHPIIAAGKSIRSSAYTILQDNLVCFISGRGVGTLPR